MVVVVLPEPGTGPETETASPHPGTALQPPAERIEPNIDPRFVDDGTSPSDNLPRLVPPLDDPHPLPQIAKSSPVEKSPLEKSPVGDKLPGVKVSPERDEPAGSLRGVTQK